ncbi:MAG: hypothetical protein J5644_08320 [Bacteroidales bacterium]|nr:hypothetical protein [Bacteroidales bacterium]
MRKTVWWLGCCVMVLALFACKSKTQQNQTEAVGAVETVELNQAAIGVGMDNSNNETLPGAKVEEMYGDNQAKVVAYYKVDENGQLTDEKYREVYYYDSTHYKYIEGNLDQTRRDGDWFAYHKNGNLCTEAHYVNGKEEGMYKVYHDNGYLYYAGNYQNGKRNGLWKFYDEQGRLMYSQKYENGTLKETILQNNNNQ